MCIRDSLKAGTAPPTAEAKWRSSLAGKTGTLVFTAKSTTGPAETCTVTI